MELKETIQTMTRVRHDQYLYIFWRNVYKQTKLKQSIGETEYQQHKKATLLDLIDKT